jgi:hypothetical protein
MATLGDATVNHTYPTTSVNSSSLGLFEAPPEAGYDGAVQRVARAHVLLPSGDRVFLSITIIDVLSALTVAVIASLFITLLIALLGCGRPEAQLTVAAGHPEPAVVQTVTAVPLRIAILQDKTGSSTTTRTPLLTSGQLQRFLAICHDRGGEITFGLIRDESNHLFERMTIGPPPHAPVKAVVHRTNALALQAAQHAADEQFNADMKNYLPLKSAWDRSLQARENAFLANVERLLAGAPDAQHTDVNGGVARADLFLSEDDAIFGAPTHRYLVVISDGIDNVHKPAMPLKSGATVVVVNGIGSLGSLADLHPRQFENVDAALSFIASKEGAKPLK